MAGRVDFVAIRQAALAEIAVCYCGFVRLFKPSLVA